MPWQSKAQERWGHTEAGKKALGGEAAVHEWDEATKGKSLPARKGYAQGGIVEKGEKTHHQNHEHPARPSIGGHNDGHGIFAHGGPVRNDKPDRFYKAPNGGRSQDGRFLGTEDRFTGGRKPAGYPQEEETEEQWAKPRGIGRTDADDEGDTKCLKPVLPHTTGGNHWYGKK